MMALVYMGTVNGGCSLCNATVTLWLLFVILGLGIPKSLPLTHTKNIVAELLAKVGRVTGMAYSDSRLIHAAVELGRSRMPQSHRGKGFRDMVEVIDSARAGELRIYSNAGCYIYRVEDGESVHKHIDYRDSILGTLIQWIVPVRQEASV